MQHLIETLNELQAAKVDLYLHQQSLDTSTPAGMALFQMLGVFAQFERSMIVARVTAGMARAKAHGTKTGKAIGRPKVSRATEAAIRAELVKGTGILKTAKMLRVGSSTVQKVKHAMAA